MPIWIYSIGCQSSSAVSPDFEKSIDQAEKHAGRKGNEVPPDITIKGAGTNYGNLRTKCGDWYNCVIPVHLGERLDEIEFDDGDVYPQVSAIPCEAIRREAALVQEHYLSGSECEIIEKPEPEPGTGPPPEPLDDQNAPGA